MEEFSFRQARLSDCADVAHIASAVAQKSRKLGDTFLVYPGTEEVYKSFLNSGFDILLVIRKGVVAGFSITVDPGKVNSLDKINPQTVSFLKSHFDIADKYPEDYVVMYQLAVHPKFQKSGIGKKLAISAIRNKKGVYAVGAILEKPIKNPVKGFWESVGARRIGEFSEFDKQGNFLRQWGVYRHLIK